MTPPPALPQAQSNGWWSRHWRWAMPLGVLACIAGLVGVVWLALAQWSHWSRSSEPYQEAMRRARCSIELRHALGEPIQDGYLPSGNMQRSADGTGYSEFVVDVKGSKGTGQLFLEARREDGRWDYPRMYVLTETSEAVDLTALDDAEAAKVCALQECREQNHCLPAPPQPMD